MKKVHLLIVIAILILLVQFTRFENNLFVSYDGDNFTAAMGTHEFKFDYANVTFDQIAARFQKSAKGETGLRKVFISGSNEEELFSYSRTVLYLFGRDVFGTLVRGQYKEFNATFGDWSLDNSISYNVVLYNNTLPKEFSIDALFIGRGYKSLKFLGSKNITFEIYDGLLGNKFCVSRGKSEYTHCICPGAECSLAFNDDTEPISWNLMRILNFFAEVLLASLFIILLVILLTRRLADE